MTSRRRLVAVAALCLATGYFAGSGASFSEALFSTSRSSASSFSTAESFAADTVAPTVDSSVVAKSSGYAVGYIRQGGSYYIYANVSDGGDPTSGVATVTADAGTISSGQMSVALSSGSYSAGGLSYGWRSALLTADNPLAAGSKSYSIGATDNAGNGATRTDLSVVVDNTAPSGTDVETANGGLLVGTPEAGDTITYTFSEPLEPESILPNWTGSSTSVVVRISNNAGGDTLTVRNGANTAKLALGSVNLVGTAYVSADLDFGATGTPSTMTMSGNTIKVVLGAPSGNTGTELVGGNMTWTPSSDATDRAGNACSTNGVTETDLLADAEF